MKTTWFDVSPQFDLTPPGHASMQPARHDFMIRVQSNNTTILKVGVIPTVVLANAVEQAVHFYSGSLAKACETLGRVIDRLKDRESYGNYYRDFLLGTISEEEFEEVAEQFAYTPQIANRGELAEDLKALFEFTNQDFTKHEVAELFRVREEDVDEAIALQLPLFGSAGHSITP